jgi:hypothetical protein
VESPARACDVDAVFDEVSAGAFADAGRDRPAVGQGGRVVEVGSLVEQVVGGTVGVLALIGIGPWGTLEQDPALS